MSTETDTAKAGGGDTLYYVAKKIYPAAVSGFFRKIKWGILIATLGVYYITPFLRWDRGSTGPSQAVLIDLPGRRAYFFFIEIWPQEVYYLTGLLIIAALTLFLMNAIAGRLWCGYLCPQTVWTDLFMMVERWIEGDRSARMRLENAPWSASKLLKRVAKHAAWLFIAMATGGAWVLYFGDAIEMVKQIFTLTAPFSVYLWIAILTFTTYTLAGIMREQVCIYMCPWPRIQAALTDDEALNVTYRVDRGEPRNSLKKAKALAEQGVHSGDCIDCNMCVNVCPTGVDIRHGLQLPCIQCGLCIDACDTVMTKIGKPTGLIAYDTDKNIYHRERGEHVEYRLVRPRTILYTVLITAIGGFMTYVLANRTMEDVNVLHDRNPVYVQLSAGGVRNGYTVRLLNKAHEEREFELIVDGLPGAEVSAIGQTGTSEAGFPILTIGPDMTREFRVLVAVGQNGWSAPATDIVLTIKDVETGITASANDFFKAP